MPSLFLRREGRRLGFYSQRRQAAKAERLGTFLVCAGLMSASLPCPGLSRHMWVTSSLGWGVGLSVVCLPGGQHQKRFRGGLGSLTAPRSVAVCWWNWEAEVQTELGQVLGGYFPAGPCAVRDCAAICWAKQKSSRVHNLPISSSMANKQLHLPKL